MKEIYGNALPVLKYCARKQSLRFRDIPCSHTKRAYLCILEHATCRNLCMATFLDICSALRCPPDGIAEMMEWWTPDSDEHFHARLYDSFVSEEYAITSWDRLLFSLPDTLAELRHLHHLSLRLLEKRTGMDHSNLTHREQGLFHCPSLRTMEILADGMDITLTELFACMEKNARKEPPEFPCGKKVRPAVPEDYQERAVMT